MSYIPPAKKEGPAKMTITAKPSNGAQVPYDRTQILMSKMNASNTAAAMIDAYSRLMAANAAINPLKESEIRILLDAYRKASYEAALKDLHENGTNI